MPHNRSWSRWPEILFGILASLFILFWILHSRKLWQICPGADWNSSEWMIDYSGGFVRRGLGGTILKAILRATGWTFLITWVTGSSLLAVAVSGWFVYRIAHLEGPVAWRAALLFNPLLFLSATQTGTFLRKDLLFAAASILLVWLARRLLERPTKARLAAYAVSVASMATVLALVHEGIFLFAWLPLQFALAVWTLSRIGRHKAIVLIPAIFLPSTLATAASVIRHGTPAMAEAIARSWQAWMRPSCMLGSLPPEVAALGWTSRQGLATTLAGRSQWPLFIGIAVLATAIALEAVRVLVPGTSMRRLLLIAMGTFIAALPLFVLGMDWGRWFCILGRSAFPVIVCPALFAPEQTVEESLPAWITRGMRWLEHHPILVAAVLLAIPMAPFPSLHPLLTYNPVFLLLNLVEHVVGLQTAASA